MRRKAAKQSKNKFMRIITLPFRVLSKAGDVYVRGVTSCSNRRVKYTAPEYLPRTLSSKSAKSLGMEVHQNAKALPKSCSVAMQRIDEDEPCEFGENDDVKKMSTKMTSRRSTSIVIR